MELKIGRNLHEARSMKSAARLLVHTNDPFGQASQPV